MTNYYFKIHDEKIFKEFDSYNKAAEFFLDKQEEAVKIYRHALCYWCKAEDEEQVTREWKQDDGV